MSLIAAVIVLGALMGPMSYCAVLRLGHERRERARTLRAAALLHHPDIAQLDAHLDMWYG